MRLFQSCLVLALAATLASCSDDDVTTPPATTGVAPAAGIPATFVGIVAGAEVPVSVIVSNAKGPAANVSVTFTPSGSGTATPSTVTTGADGRATTQWRTEATVASNTLTATADGRTTQFTAATIAGPAARLSLNAGNSQSAIVGTAVPIAPSVRVTDTNNNLVTTPVAVTFSVASGGGSVDTGVPTVTLQSAAGLATVSNWRVGPTVGTNNNTLTASSTGLTGSPVTFTASGTAGAAASVAVSAGQGQSATAGTTVPVPPAVVVRDALGNPKAGVEVTFAVTVGGGTVAPSTRTTDAQGVAAVTGWVLGTTVGANAFTATAAGLTPVTFTATGVAGAAARLEKAAGDNQSAAAGTAVPLRPTVRITDTNGNPVANASVTFAITGGGGSLAAPATVQTNAAGIATASIWTLGPIAGANTLSATSGTLVGSPVQFTATATQVAASIAVNAGNNQSAVAGGPVAVAPSVIVKDAVGNPIAGIDVLFAVTAGGGSVAPSVAVKTNAQGIASVTSWTLGTVVADNPNTLRASVPATTLPAVTFTATAVSGAAAKLALHLGDGQSAAAATAVAVPPSVRITDANDNPVGDGTAVTFAITSGGGSITGSATVQTDASGIATIGGWVLGPTAGANTLTATSGTLSGSPVTFTATGTQVPISLTVNAGNNQTAVAGTAVATAPSVIVRDAGNNPMANVDVIFSVTSGGGVVVPTAVVKTNAQGIATATSWTLGATVGANTLRASVTALAPVTFNATGVAGAAARLTKHVGDNQSATIGTGVATPPAVRITDINNNPVGAGTSVTFSVASGGGSVNGPATVQTNAAGIATIGGWFVGPTAGANTLVAISGTLIGSPATFTATATAQVPFAVVIVAGNNQSATVGTAVTTAPSVVVRDGSSLPIPGVTVTFAITGGGGAITGPAAIVTDANGVATVGGWTLGTTAGTNNNNLSATVTGLSPATFIASATLDVASILVRNSVSVDSGVVFGAVTPPSVRVTDQYNNPVPGVAVTFAVASGTGSIGGTNPVTTNASGIATIGSWTLGNTNGATTVTATSGSLTNSPLTFTAHALVDYEDAAWENTRSAAAGGSITPRVGVRIVDHNNALVAGVSVTFTITGGGGTFGAGGPTSVVVVTNVQGKAVVSASEFWFLGSTPGLNTMTATANIGGRLLVLTFRANGT